MIHSSLSQSQRGVPLSSKRRAGLDCGICFPELGYVLILVASFFVQLLFPWCLFFWRRSVVQAEGARGVRGRT